MTSFRSSIFAHRNLAALLVAAALFLRFVVPVGFMPTMDQGKLIVGVCSGAGVSTVVLDIPGSEREPGGHAAAKSCAFADLSLPSLSAADPILLAALILFNLALGLRFAVQLAPQAVARLRPPSRGPPGLS